MLQLHLLIPRSQVTPGLCFSKTLPTPLKASSQETNDIFTFYPEFDCEPSPSKRMRMMSGSSYRPSPQKIVNVRDGDIAEHLSLTNAAFRQALWDALLEYKMLPLPLTEKKNVLDIHH